MPALVTTRRKLPLIATLFAFCATPAFAVGGFDFGSHACWPSGFASSSALFACTSNTGDAVDAYASVHLPADLTSFVGASSVVELFTSNSMLPSWWQIGPGGCRAGALTQEYGSSPMDDYCPDLWGGQAPFALASLTVNGVGPNRFRILGEAVLPDSLARAVAEADAEEYTVFRLRVSRSAATGPASCPGCTTPVCLVLREIGLHQSASAPNHILTTPLSNNLVSYGGAFNCLPVPVRNRTWGAVKSLYH